MLSQITKQISENISQSLAKHAPAQNLGQNFSHQNLAKPAQNLASQATQIKASQSLAPQTQTRQALTRFGNELATNTQGKPTQAVFDFDFIARDKTPELPQPQQTPAKNPPASEEGLSQNPPPTAEGLFDNPPPTAEGVRGWVDLPSTPKPQAQPLQARFDELKDFASKIATHTENLSQEAKSLYDSFAKSLESIAPETLSAKELNKADRNLAEYLANTELAQVSNAQEIILPYFSAKYRAKSEAELAQTFGNEKLAQMRQALQEAKHTNPLSEFGTNYAEFYQDGKGAIAKLIAEANAAKQAGQDFNGQVAGAFSKEIDGAMGSIDLVWGKITNAQTHEGYGLAHIIDKHPELDLSLIPQIIERGKVESKNGIHTIWYKKDDDIFKVGISQGFKGEGNNKWIITAYQSTREKDKTFGDTLFTAKQPLANSSSKIIPQNNIRESLNDTLKEAFDIFKTHNKDEANNKLFDRVIEVASKLDVRYWEQVNPKWVNGTYTFWLNRAMVDTKLLKSNPQRAAQTILHELIHGVTSRAIYAYDNGLREFLTKTQIEGITELKRLYNEVRKNNISKAWIKHENSKENALLNEGKIYGLSNEHEFLAELANKSFRDFLKGQNLFTRIIEAVAKIFNYIKKAGDETSTNAYKEAKEVLYKIMDNYKEGFTRDFDDFYKKIDFIDLDNYKKYLAKHSERVKNHSKKENIYLETLAKGGNGQGVTIGEAVFSKTLGVKSLDELENTPLTQALREIVNGERINTFYAHLGAFAKKIKKENDKKMAHNLAIITGLQGFIKSGLYKELDDAYASYLLENITSIANKDLKYRGKAINDFFAKDFADREIERLQTGNLDSLGIKESKNNARNVDIIADKNLKQGIKMENQMDNKKLKEAFGTNYADFRGNGVEAFNHLEQVKNGFVSGAFHRQDIGDIDLVWGKVWKNDKGNIEGYGLSKIIQKHPEITAQKLNDIITKGKIKTRKNEATQIFYDGHKVLLKQNWNGESLKNRWIVTAYAKEQEKALSISSRALTKRDNLLLNS